MFLLVILAIIILGVFLLTSRLRAPSTETELQTIGGTAQTEETMNTWVEILAGSASIKQSDGSLIEIKSGDEVPDGAVIVTDDKGLVEVHLPDGSTVQLDASSEAKFDQAQFDDSSETLRVRITLATGKIWSKIIELATPESYWEVKTTNAVAAVRGTAFGMEYADGDTQIIGSENTVDVQAIDPENNGAAIDAPVKVLPNKILIIRHKMLANLREKRFKLAEELKDANSELLERPFVKQAILRDKILNQKIQKWRDAGMNRLEIRRALRRELIVNRQALIKAVMERVRTINSSLTAPSGSEIESPDMNKPPADDSAGAATNDSSAASDAGTDSGIGATAPTDATGAGGTSETTTIIDTRPPSATETNLGPYFFDQGNLVL